MRTGKREPRMTKFLTHIWLRAVVAGLRATSHAPLEPTEVSHASVVGLKKAGILRASSQAHPSLEQVAH
eukprot:1852096-Alexandrium_andersonii.AAC.1